MQHRSAERVDDGHLEDGCQHALLPDLPVLRQEAAQWQPLPLPTRRTRVHSRISGISTSRCRMHVQVLSPSPLSMGASSQGEIGAGPPAKCALSSVNTFDSLGGYITGTIMPEKPGPAASVDEKDYLNAQLDSLIGRCLLARLKVLGGHKNRLGGGVSHQDASSPAA
jgi:hypothetical protein